MPNWGGAGSGAASGASAGMAIGGPWGAAIGGIGGGLAGLFGGGDDYQDPSKAAMPYYNQIPGVYHQYYDPYTQAGQQSLGQLQGQYGNLINDPTAMMNKIGSGYQQSPGYQWQVDQATRGANQGAAASGMAGSMAEQQALGKQINGLANQDYYNYVDRGLAQYGQGLQGLSGINQMGFNASSNMAGGLATNLMNQGNLAYKGAEFANQTGSGGIADMFSGAGQAGSSIWDAYKSGKTPWGK